MSNLPVLARSLDFTIILVLDRLQTQLPVDSWQRQQMKEWTGRGKCAPFSERARPSKVTCHLGADLHVLQQHRQRLKVFRGSSSLHLWQLALHLAEPLSIQSAHHRATFQLFIQISSKLQINQRESHWSLRSLNCFSRVDISSRHSIRLRSQSSSSISGTSNRSKILQGSCRLKWVKFKTF